MLKSVIFYFAVLAFLQGHSLSLSNAHAHSLRQPSLFLYKQKNERDLKATPVSQY